MKVEGKGGIVMAKVYKVENIFFLSKEAFEEGEGVPEGSRVEEGGRHYRKGLVSKKACWLGCECLDNCLRDYCKFFLLL